MHHIVHRVKYTSHNKVPTRWRRLCSGRFWFLVPHGPLADAGSYRSILTIIGEQPIIGEQLVIRKRQKKVRQSIRRSLAGHPGPGIIRMIGWSWGGVVLCLGTYVLIQSAASFLYSSTSELSSRDPCFPKYTNTASGPVRNWYGDTKLQRLVMESNFTLGLFLNLSKNSRSEVIGYSGPSFTCP